MTSLDFPHGAVAFGSAFLAGAINSVAGGGTLISFPTLIWLGLPSVTANATSTVAIWPASVSSMFGYRREVRSTPTRMILLVIPSLFGGIADAGISIGPQRLQHAHDGLRGDVHAHQHDHAAGADHRGRVLARGLDQSLGDLRIGAAMTWSTDEYRKTSRRLRTEAGYAAKQYSAILSDRKSLQA